MKASPLQPKGIVFDEVSIQVALDETNTPIPNNNFEFQGVRVQSEVGYGEVTNEEGGIVEDCMLVSLKIHIPNIGGKMAPYKISVSASGIFQWLNAETGPQERTDLMVVNGATMLYGAIREMVLNVTSRSISGGLTLPSVNFYDSKPSVTAKPDDERSLSGYEEKETGVDTKL